MLFSIGVFRRILKIFLALWASLSYLAARGHQLLVVAYGHNSIKYICSKYDSMWPPSGKRLTNAHVSLEVAL